MEQQRLASLIVCGLREQICCRSSCVRLLQLCSQVSRERDKSQPLFQLYFLSRHHQASVFIAPPRSSSSSGRQSPLFSTLWGEKRFERHKMESRSLQKFVDLQLRRDPPRPDSHKCWDVRQAPEIYSRHNYRCLERLRCGPVA